jgi:hypothetical protein
VSRRARPLPTLRAALDAAAPWGPLPVSRREVRRLEAANIQIHRALNYAQRVAERGADWARATYGECPEVSS